MFETSLPQTSEHWKHNENIWIYAARQATVNSFGNENNAQTHSFTNNLHIKRLIMNQAPGI